MTYEGLALSDLELLKVMAVARETRALVMVHAENYDVIRFLTEQLEQAGRTAPRFTPPPARSSPSARRPIARSRWRSCPPSP